MMGSLSADAKAGIAAVLKNTQHRFLVQYDDQKDPAAIIALASAPEYQFVIRSNNSEAFTTTECPGIHSESAETLQRDSFELCMIALTKWAKRAIEKQKDWIMDEFGGVADMNPH
jgi:hypothetical protein